MKKILIIAGIVIVVITAGFIFLGNKMKTDKPVYVEIVNVETGPFIHSISVNGKVTSRKIETVKASGNGTITDTGFLNKAFIKKGDVIATIQLLEEEHLKKKQEYDLNKIDYEIAEKQHELQVELFKAKAISEREMKQSEVTLLKQQLQMENLEKEIAPKQLTATFDGMLVNKKFTDQDRISNGRELYTLIDIDELCIELSVYQEDVAKCRIGQKVTYEVPGADTTFYGEILEISTVAVSTENQGRRNNAIPIFNMYCSINMEPNKDVLFGSRLETKIILTEEDSVLTVPLEAVIYREDNKVVMVKEENTAIEKVITTGRYNDKTIEILTGLESGADVITRGNLDVRDGAAVTTEKAERKSRINIGLFR